MAVKKSITWADLVVKSMQEDIKSKQKQDNKKNQDTKEEQKDK